jgi:hypothetical protein
VFSSQPKMLDWFMIFFHSGEVTLYGQLDQLGFVTHHLAFGAKNDQYTAQNIENNENT